MSYNLSPISTTAGKGVIVIVLTCEYERGDLIRTSDRA